MNISYRKTFILLQANMNNLFLVEKKMELYVAMSVVFLTLLLMSPFRMKRYLNYWRSSFILASMTFVMILKSISYDDASDFSSSFLGSFLDLLPSKLAILVGDFLAILIALWLLNNAYNAWQFFRNTSSSAMKSWVIDSCYHLVKWHPSVAKKLSDELLKLEVDLEHSVKGKNWSKSTRLHSLPNKGRSRDEILKQMRTSSTNEIEKWESGRVSGAVYHGGKEHIEFLDDAYRIFSVSNPLHTDVWPSVMQYEAEVIAMTASLLSGGLPTVCGSLTSGGTESIILATKSHLQFYRQKGIRYPEVVACTSAHAAIEKACSLMNIKLIKVPMDPTSYKISLSALKRSVSVNTIMIYGSAPSFPQGVIDPIKDLSDIAMKYGCGLHVDCCLGGFFLPFLKKFEHVEPFDFSLRGVTSMSCDTHKYGYASKGTSVVLYRDKNLRANQYFCYPDWAGGLYVTPTLAGSRPGGLVAACWASMVSLGEEGYLEAVKTISKAVREVVRGIADMEDLHILGDPRAMIVCFGSKKLNIYGIGDTMAAKGWSLNVLQKPACIHLCVTLRTAGRTSDFLSDLRDSIGLLKKDASSSFCNKTAAMYGMTGSLPSGPLKSVMTTYADVVYKS